MKDKEKIELFYDRVQKYPMLCQSCGMCEGICPVGAVKTEKNCYGQFIPIWNREKCVDCKKCVDSCPAVQRGEGERSVIGKYRGIYLVRSVNKRDVEEGSSGGAVTALLRYGLKKGVFEEVLTTSSEGSPIASKPVYTKCVDGLGGSKYVSEPLCQIYDPQKKRIAVTALPCQAKAIRDQSDLPFIFGLFCSKTILEDLLCYIARRNGADERKIKDVSWRNGKWPGKFILHFDGGENISYPYLRSGFTGVYNSYFFSSSGCLLCDDYFAESADISFGDPWGKTTAGQERSGQTVVIARSQRGQELLLEAAQNGEVILETFPVEQLIKGHLKEIYNKKTAICQRMDVMEKKKVGFSYDKSNLFPENCFKILNRFAIYNNWTLRESERKYRRVFRIPIKAVFLYRFLHAFLLTKRLRKSGHFERYLETARKESVA